MLKLFPKIVISLFVLYALGCLILYFNQEKLLFVPTQLADNHVFSFSNPFKEVNLETPDGITLNGLHFESVEKKGIILFLHGNGGSINGWGQNAGFYTNQGYDIFYLDYRGYGKSEGDIESEEQLIEDVQIAYNYLKEFYPEEKIIVSGASMGTGMAAQLAAKNNPRMLMLNSPYFSLESLIQEKVLVLPRFIIKYKLQTAQYIDQTSCPIYLFHGDGDKVIPVHHSLKLKEFNPKVELHVIEKYGHNDIYGSPAYSRMVKDVLK